MLMVGMSHSAGDNDLQLAFKHGNIKHFYLCYFDDNISSVFVDIVMTRQVYLSVYV
jgi:hypothetical protein